jgi:hypothetical protein
MPKAVSSSSISSMVRGSNSLEDAATANQIDQLVEFNILSYREAERVTKHTATRLLKEYRNRTRKR